MAELATFYDHAADVAEQEGLSMDEALAETAGLGIRLLEVSQNRLLGREKELGRELSRAGLGISAIPSYFDFGRDGDVERQSLPTLQAARELGAKRLLVIPGFHRPEDDEAERERQVLGMIDGVNRLAELAQGFGVSLVMEDYDSELAPFSTARQLRRFLDACPGLGCCFDTGNFRFAGEELTEAYGLLRDRIAHVHLKDRSFSPVPGGEKTAVDGTKLYPAPVGGGDLRLEQAVSLLRADGYDGVYTLEHFGAPRQRDFLRQSAGWARERLR